ncbi:MAG: WD40 repeat domain-containing protein [Spirulina sp. SIO3F2]|nr:WD40 repeat domain-containing protein [Spirulina sp. SIO3F2]
MVAIRALTLAALSSMVACSTITYKLKPGMAQIEPPIPISPAHFNDNCEPLVLWDKDGFLFTERDETWAIALSPDGTQLASSRLGLTDLNFSSSIHLRNLENGDSSQLIVCALSQSLAFSPDGQKIATVIVEDFVGQNLTVRSTVHLRDLAGNQIGEPFQDHAGDVTFVAFHPSGQKIVGMSTEGALYIWSTQGELQDSFQSGIRNSSALAVGVDGQSLLIGTDQGVLYQWQGGNQPPKILFDGRQDHRQSRILAIHPDGQKIVIASMTESRVHLVDIINPAIAVPLADHPDAVAYATFSADGQTLLTGTVEGTLRLWDGEGNPIRNVRQKNVIAHHLQHDQVWLTLYPLQCANRPWDRPWQVEGASVLQDTIDFFAALDVEILDHHVELYGGEACRACSCYANHILYLLVSAENAERLSKMDLPN